MRDDVGALGDSESDDDLEPRRDRKGRAVLMYRVGAGDTLIGIAKQFAIDVEDVARENKIDAGDALKPGQLLKLRVHKDAIEKATDAPRREAPAASADAKDGEAKASANEKPAARSPHHDKGEQRQKASPGEKAAGEKGTGTRARAEKKKARRKG